MHNEGTDMWVPPEGSITRLVNPKQIRRHIRSQLQCPADQLVKSTVLGTKPPIAAGVWRRVTQSERALGEA